jgi:hypothetical protein
MLDWGQLHPLLSSDGCACYRGRSLSADSCSKQNDTISTVVNQSSGCSRRSLLVTGIAVAFA